MISQFTGIFGVLFLYFFFYYATGRIAVCLLRSKIHTIPHILILGFFSYFFLFNIVALPMKVTLQPLKTLTITWGVILILITGTFLLLRRRPRFRNTGQLRSIFAGKEKYVTLLLLTLILVQVILYNLNDETYAVWDQSYYLGDTATSLYTNTISQYDPYTGKILAYLNTEYLLETYQNHSAAMCQLLGIHPMVENLTVMATIIVILYYLIFYEVGNCLFHNNRIKSVLFTGFVALLNYFSYNLFTAAEFLIIRPSEGKTILAVIILPTLFYFFLETAKEPQEKAYWRYSFLTILGAFGLNMSSIFMIPFEIGTLYLPLALCRRNLSIAARCLLLLLPCIVAIGLYLLTKGQLIYIPKSR